MTLSGPCTCYLFWKLLRLMREAVGKKREVAQWEFDKHVEQCPACQWWHSQPQPEMQP